MFKQLLLADKDQMLRCLTEKLITYSTGAGIRFSDRAAVQRIVSDVSNSGSVLRSLIHAIVQSGIFQTK